MKKYLKQIIALAALTAVVGSTSSVNATSTTLNATATFLGAISLTPTAMAFGTITYTGVTPNASDIVTLKTDSTVTYAAGAAGFADGGGTNAAGNIAISATTAQVMTVDCSASAIMRQASGTASITIDQIKVADVSAAAGGGVACTGTGNTVLTFTYTSATDNAVKVGGRIIGTGVTNLAGGTYSTANSGGTPVTVNILYQ